MEITEAQAAAAFALWERGVRADRSAFLSAEEVARLSVSDLAAGSAIYFMALLREAAERGTEVAGSAA